MLYKKRNHKKFVYQGVPIVKLDVTPDLKSAKWADIKGGNKGDSFFEATYRSEPGDHVAV